MHYSQVHRSLSRIDYLFGTSPMLAHLHNPTIGDIAVSDHAPVGVEYSLPSQMGQDKLWRFPSHLARNQDFKNHMIASWKDYLKFNKDTTPDANLLWDAGKAFMRGQIASFAAAHNKHCQKSYVAASNKIHEAQHETN